MATKGHTKATSWQGEFNGVPGRGSDQLEPCSQPAGLTRTATRTATVPIRLSALSAAHALESFRNRAISGAETRAVDRCFADAALTVTLRALCAVACSLAPRRFGPHMRDE